VSLQTTGRPLDENGDPVDGTALELDPGSPAADLFRESPHALASAPGSGMWSVLLDDQDADRPEMVLWLEPDATVLPPHVHLTRDETFESLRGELTVTVDGDSRTLSPGEAYTVDPGVPHNFANESDDFAAFRVEPPWAKTVETQYTVSGLDHDGAFGADGEFGEPGPLHALVTSEAISEETRLAVAPDALQRVLWATAGRVAKLLGHRAVREKYLADDYWRRTVEQPALS
jgi:mannose-6-phosphate isomerase-like protein (cupin superfamily)